MAAGEKPHYVGYVELRIVDTRVPMYRAAPWIASLFIASLALPWTAGAAVWVWVGHSIVAAQRAVSPGLVFAAAWNYLFACLIPPIALMLVARTRRGPITWRRLPDRDRRLFAKTMLATMCIVSLFFFALTWQANQLMIVPVLITSFMVTLVGSMAGVLAGTGLVALKRSLRQHQRKTRMPPATFGRRHPV